MTLWRAGNADCSSTDSGPIEQVTTIEVLA